MWGEWVVILNLITAASYNSFISSSKKMVDQVSDADYIKSQDLGQVIAKGMAVMFK